MLALSSTARASIVKDPVDGGIHGRLQLARPLASFHVLPPSTDTSTAEITPAWSLAVPVIVTPVPNDTDAPSAGLAISAMGSTSSSDGEEAMRPGWSVSG